MDDATRAELAADAERGFCLCDMLYDAALILRRDDELPTLARAVTMAAIQLGGHSPGEGWIADIMEALDAADEVISIAKTTQGGEVNLNRLRDAIEKVQNWGLDPNQRMGNAFQHIIRVLSMIMIAIRENKDGSAQISVANMINQIEEMLTAIGFSDEARHE